MAEQKAKRVKLTAPQLNLLTYIARAPRWAQLTYRPVSALVRHGFVTDTHGGDDRFGLFRITDAGRAHLGGDNG